MQIKKLKKYIFKTQKNSQWQINNSDKEVMEALTQELMAALQCNATLKKQKPCLYIEELLLNAMQKLYMPNEIQRQITQIYPKAFPIFNK